MGGATTSRPRRRLSWSMACLIAWTECSCVPHITWDVEISESRGLSTSPCPEMLHVYAHDRHILCTVTTRHTCRSVSDMQGPQTVAVFPPVTSQKPMKYVVKIHKSPENCAQFSGMPPMAPLLHRLAWRSGLRAECCSCATPAQLIQSSANNISSQAHVHLTLAPPLQQALQCKSARAVMAEAEERVKDRAPRSRYRADGARRRTKGERITRAPRAAYWKERQKADREARERDASEAPWEQEEQAPARSSTDDAARWSHHDYDADNNWWN